MSFDTIAEITAEKEGQSYMLRDESGTPLSSYFNVEPTSVFASKQKETHSFTPKFDSQVAEGEIIALTGSDGQEQYFTVTKPLKGQEKPYSIFAKRLPTEEFQKLHKIPIYPVPPKEVR